MASRSDAPPGSPVRAADAPGPGDPPGSVASEEETPASDATEASPEAPARASADAALASSRGMAFAYNRHHVPPVPPDPPAVSRAGPTPLIDPSAVPEVLRAVALEDGCVKVNFRDNTVLALDPTGAAFTAHAPDGESVRQLADFAVTRFANKLRLALEFRNAHVDVPYYPPAVMLRGRRSSFSRTTENPTSASGDAAPRVFRCSRRVSVARWSRDATSAAREGLLTRLASGAVALESADGVARVVLSAHGLVATVTYPLLFERKDDWTRAAAPEETDAEENEAGSRPTAFDYVWHTQTFAADACPSRWAFPVALLTAAAYTNGSEEEEEDASDANEATTPRKDASPSSDFDAASSKRLRAAGSATVLPHSASADSRAGRPRVPLWVDEGDDAEAEWWRSPSLAGFPPAPLPPSVQRATASGSAVHTRSRRHGDRRPRCERVPGQTNWIVRGAQSRSGVPWGVPVHMTDASAKFPPDANTPDENESTSKNVDESSSWTEAIASLDDGSAVATCSEGRCVLHVPDEPNGAALARMYRADAVPERVGGVGRFAAVFAAGARIFDGNDGNAEGGKGPTEYSDDEHSAARLRDDAPSRVPLAKVAARLVALRAAGARPPPNGGDASKKSHSSSSGGMFGSAAEDSESSLDPWAVSSADVVEESSGGGVGDFVAFADGRVRAVFADRTILELRADANAARILTAAGERVEVRTAAPMAWASYVVAAAEFSRWAKLAPDQRERAANEDRAKRSAVEAEIDGIARLAKIVAESEAAAGTTRAKTDFFGENVDPRGETLAGDSRDASRRTAADPAAPRSPLREARRAPPLAVSVPASPLDGAKIRRASSLRSASKEEEEEEEGAPRTGPNSRAGGRALFAAEDDETSTGEGVPREAGGRGVAAVAAEAASGAASGEGSFPSPPPKMSVAEALAATAKWLDGASSDDERRGGEEGANETGAGEATDPTMARARRVGEAVAANEAWFESQTGS